MHTRYPGKLKHHLSNYNRRATIGLSFELFRIVPRSHPIRSRGGWLCTDFPDLDVQARRYIYRETVCGWIRNAGIDFCCAPPPVSMLRYLWARMER